MRKPVHLRERKSPLEGDSQAAKQARRAANEGTFTDRLRLMYRNYDAWAKGRKRKPPNPQNSRWHHQLSAEDRKRWRELHSYIAVNGSRTYNETMRKRAEARRKERS